MQSNCVITNVMTQILFVSLHLDKFCHIFANDTNGLLLLYKETDSDFSV